MRHSFVFKQIALRANVALCRSCPIADMTPPERSEDADGAIKAAIWGGVFPPGKRVLWDVYAPLSLRRVSFCFYGLKMVFERGLCIEFLLLRHNLNVFQSCDGFRLSPGRAQAFQDDP